MRTTAFDLAPRVSVTRPLRRPVCATEPCYPKVRAHLEAAAAPVSVMDITAALGVTSTPVLKALARLRDEGLAHVSVKLGHRQYWAAGAGTCPAPQISPPKQKPVLTRPHLREVHYAAPDGAALPGLVGCLSAENPDWSLARCVQRARVLWLMGVRA